MLMMVLFVYSTAQAQIVGGIPRPSGRYRWWKQKFVCDFATVSLGRFALVVFWGFYSKALEGNYIYFP